MKISALRKDIKTLLVRLTNLWKPAENHVEVHQFSSAQTPEITRQCAYSAACCDFVKSVGKGTLLPVTTIDCSDNVALLRLVVKSRKKWFYLFEKVEYKPSEFQITDILTDRSNIEVKSELSDLVVDYNKVAKMALKGKIGADIAKNILGVAMNVKDSIMIDVDFGTVQKHELETPDLLRELMMRRINLDHPYIRQLREDESKTLCVVTAVSDLKCGGVIKQQSGTDLSATATATIMKKVSVTGGTDFSKEREILLPPKTPVAYRVHELAVDKEYGSVELVLAGSEGGFVNNIGSSFVLQRSEKPEIDQAKLEVLFRPILTLPKEERLRLSLTLQSLMSVPRDLCILADIIDVHLADSHSIKELKDQLILPKKTWLPLFTLSGFSVKGDSIFPPNEETALFESISEVLDSISVLDDDVLELLPFCKKEESVALMTVLSTALQGNPVNDPQVIELLKKVTATKELLEELQFDVEADLISPAVELPATIDEVYMVLFVLWG